MLSNVGCADTARLIARKGSGCSNEYEGLVRGLPAH